MGRRSPEPVMLMEEAHKGRTHPQSTSVWRVRRRSGPKGTGPLFCRRNNLLRLEAPATKKI